MKLWIKCLVRAPVNEEVVRPAVTSCARCPSLGVFHGNLRKSALQCQYPDTLLPDGWLSRAVSGTFEVHPLAALGKA